MRAIIKKGLPKRKKKVNNINLKRLLSMNKRLYHSLTQPQEEYIDLD